MAKTLLLEVPHRQVVFTIPKALRIFFKFSRRLLGNLCRSAVKTPIVAIQTFGDRINFHPHLHILVIGGGEILDDP